MLRQRAAELKLRKSVIDQVFQVMSKKGANSKEWEKLCTLGFGEIHLSDQIEIVKKLQKVCGPSKTYQVGIVRSLFSRWKQPIFFKYIQQLTKEIVEETIFKLFLNWTHHCYI